MAFKHWTIGKNIVENGWKRVIVWKFMFFCLLSGFEFYIILIEFKIMKKLNFTNFVPGGFDVFLPLSITLRCFWNSLVSAYSLSHSLLKILSVIFICGLSFIYYFRRTYLIWSCRAKGMRRESFPRDQSELEFFFSSFWPDCLLTSFNRGISWSSTCSTVYITIRYMRYIQYLYLIV